MKQTVIQLLKESIDYEMKLGTKMVVNWDMYIEMEKEQMNDTWEDSRLFDKGDDYIGQQKSFEQYYNETFNTNEK